MSGNARLLAGQDSSKGGGAVETGCSGLHYIIGCFTIYYYIVVFYYYHYYYCCYCHYCH